MNILYINTFEGVSEEGRYDKIIKFIKQISPDIVVLLELDNWDKNGRIEDISEKIGLPNTIFSEGNIGIISKEEIKNKEEIERGVLKCNIKDYTIIAVHLDHKTEDTRIKQIERVLKEVTKKSVIIGDFNSISPLDHYNEKDLIKELKEKKIKKFGEFKIKKEVHKRLIKEGLIDTLKLFSKGTEYSVPTEYNTDINHFTQLRIDYAYVSPDLKEKVIDAKIIRTPETEQLSDHYPVSIRLRDQDKQL